MIRSERSDEQLVDALTKQDTRALEELYDRYKTVAYSLAYRILGDRGAAEDVLQDAFLRLWRRAASFQGSRGTVRGWLMAIVHHRAIDMLRSATTSSSELAFDEVPEYESEDIPPWQAVWDAQRGELVRGALDRLPLEQKKSIELAYFSGYTQVEIAGLMGVPLGTVKGRVRMGLEKLKNLLNSASLGATSS